MSLFEITEVIYSISFLTLSLASNMYIQKALTITKLLTGKLLPIRSLFYI